MEWKYRQEGREDEFNSLPVRHTFPQAELITHSDNDVRNYLSFVAYGTDTPDPDAVAISRADTLLAHKSAISVFMPRQGMEWDPVTQQGNPTFSTAVRDFISFIRRRETRGEGAPSHARRPIQHSELMSLFIAAHLAFGAQPASLYLLIGVVAMQWHIIGRIDDSMRLGFDTITHSVSFPFALIFKMCASKNIRNERQLAEQIMLGSMNPLLCVLLNLGA